MSSLDLERCWVVGCTRCANEAVSYETKRDDAQADLDQRGWADDCCPDCNGVSR